MTCAEPGCCCEAVPDSTLCVAHVTHTVRGYDHIPIHCYACGELIRKGQRWTGRAEGAFHSRPDCLSRPLHGYAIKVGP